MTTPAHKSEGVNRTKTVRFYSFFGNDEDLQWRADKLFKQSLEQVNYRVLHENDLECIMRNRFAKEEFGYRIDGTPYQTKADISFDHSQLNEMLDDLNHGEEKEVFFYHSDHLGSASWITDSAGIAVQHLQYLPYGEPYIDQRAAGTTYRERFRFTGKERDKETGYGYFGARYMDHELMTMWLSVDPMADKYPSISPYNYCMWNPIKLVDPNGMDTIRINLDEGTFEHVKAKGDHSILYYKDGEIAARSNPIDEKKCSFNVPEKPDMFYSKDNKKEVEYYTYHLYCSNSEIGESIFKKIAEVGSPVEWDYYSIKMGYDDVSFGDLSSSGESDKMIHMQGQYSKFNVNYWNHYHPNNNSESFFPSYSDQRHARELGGVRCTMFNNGRSMVFNKYVPSKEGGYINVHEFRMLWDCFSK